jgi:hypothetical protein
MRYLTRTIWILSIISLLTDVASEMLYPVMPIYLTGWVWSNYGAAPAFLISSGISLGVFIYIRIPVVSDRPQA